MHYALCQSIDVIYLPMSTLPVSYMAGNNLWLASSCFIKTKVQTLEDHLTIDHLIMCLGEWNSCKEKERCVCLRWNTNSELKP